MTHVAAVLLREMKACHERGAFATACHGEWLKAAHELEEANLARWCGNSFGSNFYQITDQGLESYNVSNVC